ncbi:hypothetical protein [Glaciimonas sp. PAMC28666]|nr:hypothetical protein [Glaciimonas sp. PAMC28666]
MMMSAYNKGTSIEDSHSELSGALIIKRLWMIVVTMIVGPYRPH